MVLWNSKLSVSRHTSLFSTGVHGGVAMAALLAPWPVNSVYFWLPSLAIIMVSWIWSQKNIRHCQGRLVLLSGNKVYWQKAGWDITQPPWFSRYGILVTLHAVKQTENAYDQRAVVYPVTSSVISPAISPVILWVASDSVSPEAWRHLNQLMHQYPDIDI
ncbi:hypothetical protein FE394_10800 [Xenorhabdus sp. Reich]|uniref:Toxin CptA n=1 Tax=Xenorhabdus littoralis TaxID=2582835 RepID=A0ABU4SM13_9GAMM|nr:protein YgfX [Xenorhabdus sp. Reich]MDX7999683.1 hypothetical protein [Xenorhabdus sp. Reich]